MKEHRLQRLFDGGLYLEGPRWHEGRLWLVDSLKRILLSIDSAGKTAMVCDIKGIAGGAGFLPNGELVVTSMLARKLLKLVGGQLVPAFDLSGVASGTIDDMIIDGHGRIYVGDLGFDLADIASASHENGQLILVKPDGSAKVVAQGLRFPNGIAVTEDEQYLIVAESDGNCLTRFEMHPDGSLQFCERFGNFHEPDGICLDREGAVWVSLYQEDSFVRVNAKGCLLDRISVVGRRAVACVLGGPNRRTLFCISADTTHEELLRGRSTARVDAIDVSVEGAGYP